jgi:MFS family permease
MADAGTVSRGSRRAVVAAGIGTLIEGYDLLIYGYLASSLAGQFFPAGDPTAALLNTFAIFALGFVVRPLGGVVFGHVGDRLGRRTALITSILLMAIATLGIGVLPPYRTIGVAAPILLLICRLLQGFSIGGEYVGANIMVLEHSAVGRSGRTVSVNQVAAYLGAAAAAATSLLLASTLTPEQLAGWGWRLPFLAAVPLGLVGLYLRARVPESPALPAARDARPGLPVLVLSQHVEPLYARDLLASGECAIGYLLKDRVADVVTFVEAVRTVAAGGTVLDPEVVSALIARAPDDGPVSRLTPRERDVLGLMAEGRSNAAIAAALFVTEKAISKHTSNIFMKLDLDPDDDSSNRRVKAVIAYLQS